MAGRATYFKKTYKTYRYIPAVTTRSRYVTRETPAEGAQHVSRACFLCNPVLVVQSELCRTREEKVSFCRIFRLHSVLQFWDLSSVSLFSPEWLSSLNKVCADRAAEAGSRVPDRFQPSFGLKRSFEMWFRDIIQLILKGLSLSRIQTFQMRRYFTEKLHIYTECVLLSTCRLIERYIRY